MEPCTSRRTLQDEEVLKLLYFSLSVIFLISVSSGASFGSYPVDSEKEVESLQASFRLALFNPGNTTASVKLSTERSKDYNVTFPEKVIVEPSKVTKTPSGSGWFHLGDGSYTSTEKVEFTVDISRYRSTNTLKIPVTVKASNSGAGTGEAISELVYLQDHVFTAEVVGREIEDQSDNHKDEEGVDWIEVQEDIETEKESGKSSAEREGRKNSSKTYKPEPDKNDNRGSGVDKTTLALMLGIMAMAVYLYRVS